MFDDRPIHIPFLKWIASEMTASITYNLIEEIYKDCRTDGKSAWEAKKRAFWAGACCAGVNLYEAAWPILVQSCFIPQPRRVSFWNRQKQMPWQLTYILCILAAGIICESQFLIDLVYYHSAPSVDDNLVKALLSRDQVKIDDIEFLNIYFCPPAIMELWIAFPFMGFCLLFMSSAAAAYREFLPLRVLLYAMVWSIFDIFSPIAVLSMHIRDPRIWYAVQFGIFGVVLYSAIHDLLRTSDSPKAEKTASPLP